MKLYLVHCGFYDPEVCDGLCESHVNFFVSANSFEEARLNAKKLPEFQNKRMHVDGFHIQLEQDQTLENKTVIVNHKHRDLAPKPPTNFLKQ